MVHNYNSMQLSSSIKLAQHPTRIATIALMTTTPVNTNNRNLSIDGDQFIVLINSSNEYSLWPASKELPIGWNTTNFSGTKDECKSYVDQHWLSLMPISKKSTKH